MNAEQILLKTLLGDAEYRSVIYDVEPDMLPRGISTPGNMRFSVRDMTMFEEVYDAYVEELNAAVDRALTHLDENGGHTLTLERIPETAHTLASIAYAVFFFGWAKMPEMLSAIQRDFTGHEQLKQQLADVPAYGEGDDFQDSLGLQIAGVFNKRVTAHRTPDGQAVEAITPVE